MPTPKKGTKGAASSKTEKEFAALAKRAAQGDESAMPAIREAMRGLWDQVGDVAKQTLRTVLEKYYGQDLVFREGVERRLKSMTAELAGADPSPLELLLADRIAVCWLHMQYAEAIYAQNLKDLNVHWAEHYQRRIDRAHRRFLSAIKTLATVRKLALPVLQVNIGDKQVNIAGANTPQASGTAPRVVGGEEAATEAKETAREAQKGLPAGE
ncbi:hypothetical protein LLH23_15120 [bacterium]|nr:hypothetical protein [bacterium]